MSTRVARYISNKHVVARGSDLMEGKYILWGVPQDGRDEVCVIAADDPRERKVERRPRDFGLEIVEIPDAR